MGNLDKVLLPLTLFILSSYNIVVLRAETELCNKGSSDGIFWFDGTNCPYGVLFPKPIYVDCLASTDSVKMKADVCKGETVDRTTHPIKIQYIPKLHATSISEEDICLGKGKCGNLPYLERNWHNRVVEPVGLKKEVAWATVTIDPETGATTVPDPKIGNQTLRLFRFLMGTYNDGYPGPNLRIVTLLRKSIAIQAKFCSSRYVSAEFGQDTLKAFLFLLSEVDTSKIMDIPIEDFKKIDAALNHCLDQEPPFKFHGMTCQTHAYVRRIIESSFIYVLIQIYPTGASSPTLAAERSRKFVEKSVIKLQLESVDTPGGRILPKKGQFRWKPELYDIPVEATWAAMDFTHGLCYGMFKEHVNSHHLYQQALERIFTKDIQNRWTRPTILGNQQVWDNFFSSNVRNTIENVEYCVQAAYSGSPFLHRLERMTHHFINETATTTELPLPAAAPPPGDDPVETFEEKRRRLATEMGLTTPPPRAVPEPPRAVPDPPPFNDKISNEEVAEPVRRRRRRSIEKGMPGLEDLKMYCFKTEEQRATVLADYKRFSC